MNDSLMFVFVSLVQTTGSDTNSTGNSMNERHLPLGEASLELGVCACLNMSVFTGCFPLEDSVQVNLSPSFQ